MRINHIRGTMFAAAGNSPPAANLQQGSALRGLGCVNGGDSIGMLMGFTLEFTTGMRERWMDI